MRVLFPLHVCLIFNKVNLIAFANVLIIKSEADVPLHLVGEEDSHVSRPHQEICNWGASKGVLVTKLRFLVMLHGAFHAGCIGERHPPKQRSARTFRTFFFLTFYSVWDFSVTWAMGGGRGQSWTPNPIEYTTTYAPHSANSSLTVKCVCVLFIKSSKPQQNTCNRSQIRAHASDVILQTSYVVSSYQGVAFWLPGLTRRDQWGRPSVLYWSRDIFLLCMYFVYLSCLSFFYFLSFIICFYW